ncbi:Hypothetical predicted protein [Olea europaea subsp. europaea]|uniref:Single-stranded DNA binding protein Ssb-like OB fold domain-containing protein n=2 Tax=Olea europaea subsp. europaea TaxID=158383 RepID=A0A8S0UH70_OLEEU|nr:Hypothetical predicted protein [Olea europaea subsp. europaea]
MIKSHEIRRTSLQLILPEVHASASQDISLDKWHSKCNFKVFTENITCATTKGGFFPMAEAKSAMRKPVFTKVDQLRPGTNGHNLVVKVVSANVVMQKGRPDGPQLRQMRIAECLVGDETGTIVFTARNDQVDLMKPEATIILRNAKIDMFKGSMRLAVDKWGRVEVTEPASFTVKEDNNLSLVEYELVNVVEEELL